ncbi:MAG: polymer-forming cytoskeletal protein [Deltaproteobacteria bacterium]|nr:polymer-forming cytoskeletal protein [Deltaproteobacteria bacterium]
MDNGTLVSAGTVVSGVVRGKGPLVIAGRVEGRVAVEGEVEVVAKGAVASEIEADFVRVRGATKGAIRARQAAVIEAGAQVEGEVHAPRLEIDPQARVKARLHMPLALPRGVRVPTNTTRREDTWNT